MNDIKMLSPLLLLISAIYAGIKSDRLNRERITELRSYIDMLKFIRTELFSDMPFQIILSNASTVCTGRAEKTVKQLLNAIESNTYTSLNELWHIAIKQNCSLCENEKIILLEAGAVMGKFESTVQNAIIDSVIYRLENALNVKENEYTDKRKLTIFLPPLLVLLMIIVIM